MKPKPVVPATHAGCSLWSPIQFQGSTTSPPPLKGDRVVCEETGKTKVWDGEKWVTLVDYRKENHEHTSPARR